MKRMFSKSSKTEKQKMDEDPDIALERQMADTLLSIQPASGVSTTYVPLKISGGSFQGTPETAQLLKEVNIFMLYNFYHPTNLTNSIDWRSKNHHTYHQDFLQKSVCQSTFGSLFSRHSGATWRGIQNMQSYNLNS